uniref:Uncharacterized protein n=1 Tax=Aegilops tauschii subsp. strangulata TaxID=200361 RepID=A0A453KC85_AEGTS
SEAHSSIIVLPSIKRRGNKNKRQSKPRSPSICFMMDKGQGEKRCLRAAFWCRPKHFLSAKGGAAASAKQGIQTQEKGASLVHPHCSFLALLSLLYLFDPVPCGCHFSTACICACDARRFWFLLFAVVDVDAGMCLMEKFKQMTKDLGTGDLVLHAKRILHSSFAVAYQSSCDYPMVLGAGILLLLLHRICPPLLAFLVSSSPLLLLTGLLLGALLSYGEPNTPSVTGEGASDNQQTLSPELKNSIDDCSTKEVESVTIETRLEKRTGSTGAYVEERAPANNTHDNYCEETNVTFVAADTVLSTESSKYAQTNVTVGREWYGEQISEKAGLREFESSNNERGDYEVHNHYQFGEPTSPCWQSADRQDPCYGSESDLTDDSSSPDASMTDIIPMLEELHPLIDLGTGHPTLASRSRDNLNSSSDDDESDLEEDDDNSISDDEAEGEEEEKDDGNDQEDVIGKNGRADGLMELQRAKNVLKFELDQKLMDLQTTDATQKLKEASRFFVQVPSISTPRGEPYDPSNASGEGEMIELPQIPDSAPSVLLQRGSLFDLPSDHIGDHNSQLQETWTPRSYSPATQLRKHGNFHGRHSANPCRSGLKSEKGEISGEDALGSHSDSDAAKQGNDGRLSCSQEAHLGEEIKILSPVISDAGVLKGDYGMHEGNNNVDSSDDINSFPTMENESSTSEAEVSVHPGKFVVAFRRINIMYFFLLEIFAQLRLIISCRQ